MDAVGKRFRQFLAGHSVETDHNRTRHILKAKLTGRVAVERTSGVVDGTWRPPIFGKGEAARRPFAIVGSRAYGPGVADMKAGLVMNSVLAGRFRAFRAVSMRRCSRSTRAMRKWARRSHAG